MRLYIGSSQQFITDAVHNQVADKLKAAFFSYYRYAPSPGEMRSWRESLRSISQVFQHNNLLDHGIILEYQIPSTSKRLDCMITGRDGQHDDNAVIIELKQWDKCGTADGENEVTTYVGGAEREVLHPSAQVGRYATFLGDVHTAFYSPPQPIKLNACSYLHNYRFVPDDVLLGDKFSGILKSYPIFSMDDVDPLSDFLQTHLKGGAGMDILGRIEDGEYRPSKKLMEHVSNVIKGNPEYILLDEQLVAYDRVRASARKGMGDGRKTVIIIKGGPGTGKSVIAINLMADLLQDGYNAQYATGSKAFTETLRKIIGARGSIQFKYFNSYMEAPRDAVDVLICDEAHRLRETSNNRYTPKTRKSAVPQIEELINAARVPVFFIDDDQVVRPGEIGSIQHIKEYASKNGCRLFEHELETQFRCNGSEAFVGWINNTLGIARTPHVLWTGEENFEFKIFDSPESMEQAIRDKAAEGHSARMTAGFCWEWSKYRSGNDLNDDVVIGDYKRPWNAKHDATKLPKGTPKAQFWAYDPKGIDQIGCVYTAQGFEFDYVGVIFGNDLKYSFEKGDWIGCPENSRDSIVKKSKGRFIDYVRNVYRVLLSRGMKGCYVYFLDKDTENFFRSRMDILAPKRAGTRDADIQPYINALPLVSLQDLAGLSSSAWRTKMEDGWKGEFYRTPGGPFIHDRFLLRVDDPSMEPMIPAGSLCEFRIPADEVLDNKVILAGLKTYANDLPKILVRQYRQYQMVKSGEISENTRILLASENKHFPTIEIAEGIDDIRIFGIFNRIIFPKANSGSC